ncbi:MAG TPA: UDP-glucose 4-epimerase, partial [Bacilli bacterium]
AANLAAIHKGHQQVIQVGTSRRTSINRLIRLLEQMHGSQISILHGAQRSGDIRHSMLDNRKAAEQLGWKPIYDMDYGLRETFNFTS